MITVLIVGLAIFLIVVSLIPSAADRKRAEQIDRMQERHKQE